MKITKYVSMIFVVTSLVASWGALAQDNGGHIPREVIIKERMRIHFKNDGLSEKGIQQAFEAYEEFQKANANSPQRTTNGGPIEGAKPPEKSKAEREKELTLERARVMVEMALIKDQRRELGQLEDQLRKREDFLFKRLVDLEVQRIRESKEVEEPLIPTENKQSEFGYQQQR